VFSCGQSRGKKGPSTQESSLLENLIASGEVDTTLYDWTPEKFKNEHPYEWKVVMETQAAQQEIGNTDKLRKLMDEKVDWYLKKKGITLSGSSSDKYKELEKICLDDFDISDDEADNFSMHIADANGRIWEDYLIWKLKKYAYKDIPNINWQTVIYLPFSLSKTNCSFTSRRNSMTLG